MRWPRRNSWAAPRHTSRSGTWIANIYLRHSYTCAKGASLIADDTGGRFVLGLGVSHQPVNDALAIDMSNAPADLHRYVIEVRNWLEGNGPATLYRFKMSWWCLT